MDGNDAIAIVGIGCKFPGADNADEYWKLLVEGRCEVKDIPNERFNVDAIYDANPNALGKTYVRKAGLMERPFHWDRHLWGLSEKEAAAMDPQQRYVLDCVHMAMEDGGLTKKDVDGTQTSVFIGAMNSDYQVVTTDDEALLSTYSVTGTSQSILSARVSYNYNLLGPAVTIDTACSSALVAVHLGAESIKTASEQNTMSICGGVSSILYPEMFITLSRARLASIKGQCHAFSANADGYARGEGCGILILEKLSEAIAKNHKVWGTIQTGCNQDGRTMKPMTAPSGQQQTKLLEDIYDRYSIDPSLVQYIEAHGTGTPIGDPIEVNSLGNFFKKYTSKASIHEDKRLIGSAKTNIGHLESAAGVAGIIKVLLMMKHGQVVPSLHAEKLNENIDFEGFQFQVPKQVYPWYAVDNQFKMACVNCFGFGGTNSHAVIKQAVDDVSENGGKCISNPLYSEIYIVAFSAQTVNSLIKSIEHFQIKLAKQEYSLQDISYTSLKKREHLSCRKAIPAISQNDLIQKCSNAVETLRSKENTSFSKFQICFVFCGVGTAWKGMCSEMVSFSAFEQSLNEIDEHFLQLSGWSIKNRILSEEDDMTDPMFCHVAIFACQVGLSKVWESCGISPSVIVGQSVGEVAAAYIAGYLSLSDAVKVIYHRSLLLSEAVGGQMMVIRNCKTELVQSACQSLTSGRANIAVYSSPVSCTVSGDVSAFAELQSILERQKTTPLFKRLDVACAYHSHYVGKAAMKLEESLSDIKTQKPRVNVYAGVDGLIGSEKNFATAKYWRSNVKKEVLFMQALTNVAVPKGLNIFVEIGPSPVLRAHLGDIFPNKACIALASMQPSGEKKIFLQTLVDMYALGVNPDWGNIAPKHGNLTDIPQYQFDQNELKVESSFRIRKNQGISKYSENLSSFFIRKNTTSEEKFNVTISPQNTPFIYNHKMDGAVVVPGAFYTEVAYELGMQFFRVDATKLKISYEISSFVSVPQVSSCELDIEIIPDLTSDCIKFIVKHKDKVVVNGLISLMVSRMEVTKSCPIHSISKVCTKRFQSIDIYSYFKQYGYDYEHPIQVFNGLKYNEFESLSEIKLTPEVQNTNRDLTIHPAVLDGMFHPLLLLFLQQCKSPSKSKVFPIRIPSVVVRKRLENVMQCYIRKLQENDNIIIANFLLVDQDGDVIVELREVEYRVLDGGVPLHTITQEVSWIPLQTEIQYPEADLTFTKILVIAMQQSDIEHWQSVFPAARSVLISYNIECNESWESTLDLLKTSLQNDACDGVVFVTPQQKYERGNEILIYDQIRKTCHIVFAIVQNFNPDAALVAVTENSQTIPGIRKSRHNLEGAAVWGYLRSARLERSYPIVLIDLQFQSVEYAKENVRQFIMNMKFSYQTDFVFTDKHVYCYNYLDHPRTKGLYMNFRETENNNSKPTEIRSRKGENISKPFLIQTNEPETSKGLTLRVEAVAHLQVIPYGENSYRGFWPETSETGYPILAFEHVGVKKHSDKNRKQAVNNRYAACFPTKCCSQINVPIECVCDLQKLPFYETGIIVPFVLAWFTTNKINANQRVYILETSKSTETIIMREMLQQKNITSMVLSPKSFAERKTNIKGTLVLNTNEVLELVSMNLQNITNIIGFDTVLTVPVQNALMAQSMHTSVKMICMSEVFDRKTLTKIFPLIRHFMEKNSYIMKMAKLSINASKIYFNQEQTDSNFKMKLYLTPKQVIDCKSSYIVVGGLTGLGWEVVKWLAKMRAGQVITLSRRLPDLKTIEKLKNTTQIHQTEIIPLQCNVCDLENVITTVERISNLSCFPIKGIYQGAGVLLDGHIDRMSREKIDTVLSPKVLGTINLYHATRHLSLDIFVLQSSIASIFGNPGQTSYSAANAFLDAFAHYCRSENRPCQSINWGALDVGMVGSNASIKHQLKQIGHFPLSKALISETLTDALKHNKVQIAYASYDHSKIGLTFQTKKMTQRNQGNQDEKRVFNAIIFNDDAEEDTVKAHLKIIIISVADLLSIPFSDIEEDQTLITLGLESQQATELIQTVYEKIGCRLPIAYLLSPEYTLHDLASFAASQRNVDNNRLPVQTRKRAISYYEKTLIDITKDKEDPFYEINILLHSSAPGETFWKAIFQYATNVTPELRTYYKVHQDEFWCGIAKVLIEPEDVAVDFHCRSDQISDDNKGLRLCKIEDSSIKILFSYTEGSSKTLRLLFNPVIFDLQGISDFMVKLCDIVDTYLRNQYMPEINEFLSPIVTDEIEKFFERQDFDQLKDHWREQFMEVKSSVTLSSDTDPPGTPFRSQTSRMISLSPNLHKVDYSKITASLYALLLSKLASVEVVPMLVSFDIRQVLLEIRDSIFFGTNFVPMIFRVPHDIPVQDHVQNSITLFRLCEPFSIYPSELFAEIDGYQPKLFRHQFQSRTLQLSPYARMEKMINSVSSILPIHDMEGMETSLTMTIYADEQKAQLHLSYDGAIVQAQVAENLLADLEHLIATS